MNINKMLEQSSEIIQKKLNHLPMHERVEVVKGIATVCNDYESNVEDLIEACDENRLIMLPIPKALQILPNLDAIEELIIDILHNSMQLSPEKIEEIDYSNLGDIIPDELLTATDDITNTSDELISVPLENLVLTESNHVENTSSEKAVERKPPIVVQEPSVEGGLFNKEQLDETPTTIQETSTVNVEKSVEKNTMPQIITEAKTDILDISTLVVGKPISVYALCATCEIGTSTKARWLEINLKDINGVQINAKLFGYQQDYTGFKGKVVKITGEVNTFNNITNIKLSEITDENIPYSIGDFVKSIPNLNEYVQLLSSLIDLVEDPNIKSMLINIFKDSSMLNHYTSRASSVSNHGTLKGDLLKHCVNVTRSALYMAKINELPVDKDILITGGLLHDLGKIMELPPVGLSEYTIEGKLLGHTFISANYMYNKGKEFNVPYNKLLNITHTILSHHGKLEYGAPITPLTIEARLISDSDMQESQAIHYKETLCNAKPGDRVRSNNRTELIKL